MVLRFLNFKVEEFNMEYRKLLITILIVLAFIVAYFFLTWDECAGIKDPYLRERCYTKKALERKDPKICDKIEDKDGCATCKKEVEDLIELEKNESNESVPRIPLPGIPGGGGGGGGESEENKSGEINCESLTGNRRDWCFRDKALENNDPSFCLKIQDSYNKDSCYRYLALANNDPSYCDYMEDDFRRTWCHEILK